MSHDPEARDVARDEAVDVLKKNGNPSIRTRTCGFGPCGRCTRAEYSLDQLCDSGRLATVAPIFADGRRSSL